MANILLYFGAGLDFSPLRMKRYKQFQIFVFVDALTKQQHYEPGTLGYEFSANRETFIASIAVKASKYDYKLIWIHGNELVFTNKERRLVYYIDTTVEDAIEDPKISDIMHTADFLHTRGFNPFMHGLTTEHLNPNRFKTISDLLC